MITIQNMKVSERGMGNILHCLFKQSSETKMVLDLEQLTSCNNLFTIDAVKK